MVDNKLLQITLNFLIEMILLEKIDISDVPYEIRILSKSLYITACRVCRNDNISKYNTVLSLLKSDISLANATDKAWLSRLYEDLKYNTRFIGVVDEKLF